jgi:hypothetical protein
MLGPVHGARQTGQSGFLNWIIQFLQLQEKEALEYYCARDGSSTSLVSSRPHVQPEEEDPVNEGTKDEG